MTNTTYFYNNYYDRRQRYEIRKGMDAGVDVSIYANPEFDSRRMYWIRKGLETNDDRYMKYLLNDNFDNNEIIEIMKWVDNNLPINNYIDNFNGYQLKRIRMGLEAGIDVSLYAKPEFTPAQMNEICKGLEAGVDVSIYANPAFDLARMYRIRKGLESGVDVPCI